MPFTSLVPKEKRPGFHPSAGKIPWRREWLPTPVFLPGKFHGQKSLAGYSSWGHKELDMTDKHFHVPFLFSHLLPGLLVVSGNGRVFQVLGCEDTSFSYRTLKRAWGRENLPTNSKIF